MLYRLSSAIPVWLENLIVGARPGGALRSSAMLKEDNDSHLPDKTMGRAMTKRDGEAIRAPPLVCHKKTVQHGLLNL